MRDAATTRFVFAYGSPLLALLVGFWLVPTMAVGKNTPAPTPSSPQKLTIAPAVIRLSRPLAVQSVAVTATFSDGSTRDVTDECAFRVSDTKTLSVDKVGTVGALRDGQNLFIAARWRGLGAKTVVSATGQGVGTAVAPSFARDVVPALSRIGCSQGGCHGAAQGKGGFKLSLRGYAPERDFATITRELGGRRINREEPERSLFLRKPLGEVAHRGGAVLQKNSRDYRILLRWLRGGAPNADTREPLLVRIAVTPNRSNDLRPGQRQRLLVRAYYADGQAEDVTGHALFSTNDPAVATVTESGVVTQKRPGEGAVLVKYRDRVAVARTMFPFSNVVPETAFVKQSVGFVDDAVNSKLRELHVPPSGPCSDNEFLRRAFVDVLGTLPTTEEARAFLADRGADKRDKLVDALLKRPEFGLVWSLKFGDLFALRREHLGRKGAAILQNWLREQFNANRPWDKIVGDLLTATGDPFENPATLYFISRAPQQGGERYWIRRAENTAEMTAQIFLGNRIQCAKCHNHPSEQTTQDDYYRFVALWRQVTGKGTRDSNLPERLEATNKDDVRQPRTNDIMRPTPLDRSILTFAKDEDRRVKTVAWMVKNPNFARNIVNRVWARCFGQGIVEPVDDLRSTNPPRNEMLMDALCRDFVKNGYDIKRLMSTILRSKTYQRTSKPLPGNRADTRYFSHYPPKRLQAEELADALAQATGVPDRYQNFPPGTRAQELPDAEIRSEMLDTFGRPVRTSPADGERVCSPAVGQALALLNSDSVQNKVRDGQGVLPVLLKAQMTDAERVETLFLSTLSRKPTAKETAVLLKMVAQTKSRDEAFQDVLWALLNTKEFLFTY